jgi:hypothetical protein
MDSGRLAYVKDGKKYEGGYFGGDIEEAVEGNAQAEGYARAYKAERVGGAATTFLGILTAAGGLVLETIGVYVLASAPRHLFDAINAYNDRVSCDSPSAQRGYAPIATTGTSATTTPAAPTASATARAPNDASPAARSPF